MRPESLLTDDDRGDRDDKALLARVRAGDRQALEALIRQHQPCGVRIRRHFHVIQSEERALAASANAFMRLLEQRARGRRTQDSARKRAARTR